MSTFGSLMDRVVKAANTAVTGLVAERDNRLSKDIESGDFPHLFVYNPSRVTERVDHQQRIQDIRILCRLVTKGETQEAFLLKHDLIVAGIPLDVTLVANSVDRFIETEDTTEDPRSDFKYSEFVVVIVQES